MIKAALKNANVVFMLTIAIVLLGVFSYISIPRESTPDIKFPYVIVSTLYPGVSPADMETLVTDPLEKKFKGLTGIKKITSSSGESFSAIFMEFDTKIDIENALQKVRDKVSSVRNDLPKDIKDPQVQEISFSEFPIMVVNISGPSGLVKLKAIADDLKDELDTVKGVLRADIVGGLSKEVKILVDNKRLKEYGLTLDTLQRSIAGENLNMPGGTIQLGESDYLLRIPGEFKNIPEIENTVIKANYGKMIRVKDVAKVLFTFKDKETDARINQQPCVGISIIKRSGENIISTAEAVKKVLKKTALPPGVKVEILGDRSIEIQDLVKELEKELLTGLILVVLVLMFFMGFRNAVIVSLAIPLSIFISITIMNFTGLTLNFVVLFALILGLGRLVDDAIVVVENIYRYYQNGHSKFESAQTATEEVSMPIFASTATTLAAYVPMLFWPGIMGGFMAYLPKTLIVTLSASYVVGMIINPVFMSKFMIKPKSHRGVSAEEYQKNRFRGPIMSNYRRVLVNVLRYPKWQKALITLLIVSFLLSIVSFVFMKKEFFPDTTPEQLYITVNTPPGSTIENTDQIVRVIEGKLVQYEDIKRYEANIGVAGAGTSFRSSGSADPTFAQIVIDLKDKKELKESPFVLIDKIRKETNGLAGVTIKVDRPKEGPPSGGAPINIRVIGKEFKVIHGLAEQIQDIMKKIPGIVEIRDDYNIGRPEIHIKVDRAKAALLGLNTYQVAATVRTAINGAKASTYRMDNEEYDITVQLAQEQRTSLSDIKQLGIPSFKGDQPFVPLASVASVETHGGLNSIPHYDLDRLITVQGDVSGKLLAPQAVKEIDKQVRKLDIPSGYRVEYGGENEMMAESFSFLGKAFVGAILLIMIILIAAFNSFVYPIIIGTTIMMGVIGVAIGLGITGKPFGLMAFIGMISLSGIVVTNAIILIEFILRLKEKGYSRRMAIVRAGLTRFRPVMLTALTTLLSLIPLTFGVKFSLLPPFMYIEESTSSAFWGPMGSVVVFGLAVATFFTLVIIPTFFYLTDRSADKIRKFFNR
ncbi:MAG: efflux RND transporter permease subunit [Candidatus Margulisiibacteriota bacterium]|jgi:CzcA family heavy metal efflux pump